MSPWRQVCNAMENVVITLATLESAIAQHGRSGDTKFPTFVQLSEAWKNRCGWQLL